MRLGGAEKRKRRIATAVFAAMLTLIAGAVIYVDARVFPVEYLTVKLRPAEVARSEGNALRVHFLPVAGRAVVLEFPDGACALVGGGEGDAADWKYTLRYLEGLRAGRLKFIAITASESGETDGALRALEYAGAESVYVTAAARENRRFSELERTAGRKGAEIRSLFFARELGVFGGCRVTALGGEEYDRAPLCLSFAGGEVLLAGKGNIGRALERAANALPDMLGAVEVLELYAEKDGNAGLRPPLVYVSGGDGARAEEMFAGAEIAAKGGEAYVYTMKTI